MLQSEHEAISMPATQAPATAPDHRQDPAETNTPVPPICTQKPSVVTSLVEVTQTLSTRAKLPCRVFFKNELEQPSGSFKLRGIGHLIQTEIQAAVAACQNPRIHVFASSGGNAGLAAAYLARFYRVKCTVVVPATCKPHIVEKLQTFGAQVVLRGRNINEADRHARHLMELCPKDTRTIYCHPYDNPRIWEGHAQIVDELVGQLLPSEVGRLRGLVCLVGGGGLYNGLSRGLERNSVAAPCVLVETRQAPTLGRAAQAGKVVVLDSVDSVATSLACSYVSGDTLAKFTSASSRDQLLTIDDTDAVRATLRYRDEFGTCVEPACGAALSVVYEHVDFLARLLPNLQKDDIVVVVVCGGWCADEASMAGYRSMLRGHRL